MVSAISICGIELWKARIGSLRNFLDSKIQASFSFYASSSHFLLSTACLYECRSRPNNSKCQMTSIATHLPTQRTDSAPRTDHVSHQIALRSRPCGSSPGFANPVLHAVAIQANRNGPTKSLIKGAIHCPVEYKNFTVLGLYLQRRLLLRER